MILDDDIEAHARRVLGKAPQSIAAKIGLFLGAQFGIGGRVDADAMTPEKFRGVEPRIVALDSIGPFGRVRVAEIANAVAHDEDTLYSGVVAALFHFAEISLVLGLVAEFRILHIEELIDPLNRFDPEIRLCEVGKIEVVEFTGLERFVQRPLGEGYLER